MQTEFNIKGLDKALILKLAYDRVTCVGLGYHQYINGDISYENALDLVSSEDKSFDYLAGRPLKIYFNYKGDPEICHTYYDRYWGDGSFQRVMDDAKELSKVQEIYKEMRFK